MLALVGILVAVVKPSTPVRLDYAVVDVPLETHPEGAHYVSWAARFPSAPQAVGYFAGPKDFDVLAAVDRDLVRAIDFGMFSFLVVPLLRALKWINLYVGNYGWSLILLTVLINLAMFPLRHKSVVSMRKMQDVQPEVKAIQDRYAKLKMSDPARVYATARMLARHFQEPDECATGIHELLLNALEHGNLEIGFEEKADLIRQGKWHDELLRRKAMPQYRQREVNITLIRNETECRLIITDSGKGFSWRKQLSRPADSAYPNGRGLRIAMNSKFDDIIFNARGNQVACRARYMY